MLIAFTSIQHAWAHHAERLTMQAREDAERATQVPCETVRRLTTAAQVQEIVFKARGADASGSAEAWDRAIADLAALTCHDGPKAA